MIHNNIRGQLKCIYQSPHSTKFEKSSHCCDSSYLATYKTENPRSRSRSRSRSQIQIPDHGIVGCKLRSMCVRVKGQLDSINKNWVQDLASVQGPGSRVSDQYRVQGLEINSLHLSPMIHRNQVHQPQLFSISNHQFLKVRRYKYLHIIQ